MLLVSLRSLLLCLVLSSTIFAKNNTVSGHPLKTIDRAISAEDNTGYRVTDIHWEDLDEFGDRIGKGVYVYNIFVQT
ncbi:MAG: hypothetical protein ACRBFS_05255 [Aureispira sp.]